MRNFLIVGPGRSGTKFLAMNMNKSEKWTVLHEAGRWHDMKRTPKELNKRFAKNYYGEVNGYLRFVADKIKVNKRGVILRDPEDLWFSVTTWHNQPLWNSKLKEKWLQDFSWAKRTTPHLLSLAESGRYHVIEFDRMITDGNYLKDIFLYFGIDDVRVTKSMLSTKINKAPDGVERTDWSCFGPKIKDTILRLKEMYQRRTDTIFDRDKADPEGEE